MRGRDGSREYAENDIRRRKGKNGPWRVSDETREERQK